MINKILFAGSLSKFNSPYQNGYLTLKKLCKEIISFDIRWTTIKYGEDKMNQMLLDFVEKEKPNFIFFYAGHTELYFDTFFKIKELSPKTKLIFPLGDDDTMFENFSRFIILFMDYGFIGLPEWIPRYKEEGIYKVGNLEGINTELYKPIKIEKEYDVTFIGRALGEKSLRYEYIKYLKDNGINVNVFGFEWDKFSDFVDIYKGPLETEEMINVLNKTKIYLCLSRGSDGLTHKNYKFFEGASCKTFVLTEYCPEYYNFTKEGKEIVSFKTKEELLEKVKYYLKNKKERDKITNAIHKKVLKDFSFSKRLKKILGKLSKIKSNGINLPKLDKKIISLEKNHLTKDLKEIEELVKDYDYITFISEKSKDLNLKEYMQVYSLLKSRKEISCCDYYVSKGSMKKYLRFFSRVAIKNISIEEFNSLIIPEQLMVTKKFFIKNINELKNIFQEVTFVKENNVNFVSFPLVETNKLKTKNYDLLKKAFLFNFPYQVYSLKYQKRRIPKYLLFLFFEVLKGNWFIFKEFCNIISNKSRVKQLKIYEDLDK